MFKNVLLSEDIDTISQGIMAVTDALHISNVEQVQYCDDAYLKIKKASEDGQPFDLLITDLSFKPDYRKQELTSGEELIKKVRLEFGSLKIIVYSIEDRPERIRRLMGDQMINGYVVKGRRGLMELKEAIETLAQNSTYLSAELEYTLKGAPSLEIIDSDIILLKMLSEGHSQDQISLFLRDKNIKPRSLSALEKRLNTLRDHFGASNAIHLVSIVKDLGLI